MRRSWHLGFKKGIFCGRIDDVLDFSQFLGYSSIVKLLWLMLKESQIYDSTVQYWLCRVSHSRRMAVLYGAFLHLLLFHSCCSEDGAAPVFCFFSQHLFEAPTAGFSIFWVKAQPAAFNCCLVKGRLCWGLLPATTWESGSPSLLPNSHPPTSFLENGNHPKYWTTPKIASCCYFGSLCLHVKVTSPSC